jgi:hypothetical protein
LFSFSKIQQIPFSLFLSFLFCFQIYHWTALAGFQTEWWTAHVCTCGCVCVCEGVCVALCSCVCLSTRLGKCVCVCVFESKCISALVCVCVRVMCVYSACVSSFSSCFKDAKECASSLPEKYQFIFSGEML